MIIHNILNMKRNFFFAVGLALSLFACDNSHDNMYDPIWVREQYENQWKLHFGEIDPNQNFNMARQVTANISIKEDALSEYTFKIYTADPLYDVDAKLMAKAKVKTDSEGFAEASIAFDAHVGMDKFYIVRVDSHGRRLLKVYETNDNIFTAYFGILNAGSRSSDNGIPVYDNPYTIAEVNQMMADGYDLKSGIEGDGVIERLSHLPLISNNVTNSLTAVVTTEMDLPLNAECETSSKLIIADGGVLKYDFSTNVQNIDIIVSDGGTLIINGCLQMWENSKLIVMPGGTVLDNTTDGYSINLNNGASFLFNAGNMKDIRLLNVNNGAVAYVANSGIYTGSVIQFIEGGASFTNWGKVEVIKLTTANDWGLGNNLGVLNNGCLFRATEKLQVLNLNLVGNTAIECETVSAPYITLRENSILRTNLLYMGQTISIKYVGAKESSALISAKKIESQSGSADISGSVYIEADTIMPEWPRTCILNATKDIHGVSRVGEAKFAIFPVYTGNDLKESDCTGKGNIPTDYVPEQKDETQTWIVACEDLGSIGDYDFNDVVFEVSYANGDTEAYVTALAGGGTLAVYICNGANVVGEIHEMFGFDDITLMINTGVDYEWNGRNGFKGKTVKIEVPSGFAMSDNMGGFYLKVMNGDGQFENSKIGPSVGVAPQMICVPSPWRWPTETIRINEAYPLFGDWGSGYDYKGHWCLTSIEDFLY